MGLVLVCHAPSNYVTCRKRATHLHGRTESRCVRESRPCPDSAPARRVTLRTRRPAAPSGAEANHGGSPAPEPRPHRPRNGSQNLPHRLSFQPARDAEGGAGGAEGRQNILEGSKGLHSWPEWRARLLPAAHAFLSGNPPSPGRTQETETSSCLGNEENSIKREKWRLP